VPVPLSTVLGSVEALLTKSRLPGELPAVCGENVTVKETLFPAATVTGKLIPLRVYPSPDASTVETVTLELLAVRDPVLIALLPTATLPNAMVVGVTESCAADVDPSPESGTEMLEFEASLAMVRVPVADPDAAGEKVIPTLTLCPGVKVAGSDGGLVMANPVPLMLT
jgi:hypothetical protein